MQEKHFFVYSRDVLYFSECTFEICMCVWSVCDRNLLLTISRASITSLGTFSSDINFVTVIFRDQRAKRFICILAFSLLFLCEIVSNSIIITSLSRLYPYLYIIFIKYTTNSNVIMKILELQTFSCFFMKTVLKEYLNIIL